MFSPYFWAHSPSAGRCSRSPFSASRSAHFWAYAASSFDQVTGPTPTSLRTLLWYSRSSSASFCDTADPVPAPGFWAGVGDTTSSRTNPTVGRERKRIMGLLVQWKADTRAGVLSESARLPEPELAPPSSFYADWCHPATKDHPWARIWKAVEVRPPA